MNKKVRVLVVDDSLVVRKVLSHMLDQHDGIEVIGAAEDAQDARAQIKLKNPDVMTLDIEMPGMDGLSFLEKVMTLRPMPVVMVSTLTQKGADASLRAMQLGAFDFFPKPTHNLSEQLELFKDELHNKVLSAALANVNVLAGRAQRLQQPQQAVVPSPVVSTIKPSSRCIIAIGSSTGGTEAITEVLTTLPENTPGIVIAQHIPAMFSQSFANRLDAACRLKVKEAQEGDEVTPGKVLIAPGSAHLKVEQRAGKWVCVLDDGPTVNRHKPSVDVLFDSVRNAAGDKAVGIILTGMGKDGAEGLLRLKEVGAETIAQDEASSVVWGMPGAAVKIGAADNIMALSDISKGMLDASARV